MLLRLPRLLKLSNLHYYRRKCKMAFTAQDVKTLREMTNVGMMDCKKALQATDGDRKSVV